MLRNVVAQRRNNAAQFDNCIAIAQMYCNAVAMILHNFTFVQDYSAQVLRKGAMMLRNFTFEQRLYRCSEMWLCKGGKMPRNYRLRN